MRIHRLALVASSALACVIIACSSDDATTATPDVDAGSSSGSSGTSGGSGTSGSSGNPADSAAPVDAATDTSQPDAAAVVFKLTSTAFTEGMSIPAANTCNGAGDSPALAWTGAPASTKSLAVVLTDTTNMGVHSVIYDIAPTNTALAAGIQKAYAPAAPAGAHQTKPGFSAPGFGYLGPCPPKPTEHIYQFAIYALTVASLPGVNMNTSPADAVTAIKANVAASGTATLTGKYKQP